MTRTSARSRREDTALNDRLIGLVLGPIAESGLRRAVVTSEGYEWLLQPIPVAALGALTVLSIAFSVHRSMRRSDSGADAAEAPEQAPRS